MPLLAPVPRKSRLPAPTLPTVIGSPRQMNMVSVIYEDGASARTSSYATAPASPKTPPPGLEERQSLKELRELFVDPDQLALDQNRDSTATNAGDTIDTDMTRRGPSGLYDAPRSDGEDSTRPNSRTELRPQNPVPPSTLSGTPRNSRGRYRSHSVSSDDSSFNENVEQRWLKGLSFGSARFAHPPPSKGGRAGGRVTHAFVLFWLGFIAPWCWLIGGWLLSGDSEGFGTSGPLLPLWHRRRRGMHVAVDIGDGGAVPNGKSSQGEPRDGLGSEKWRGAIDHKRIKATSWYPLLAPSVESLAPPVHKVGWLHRLTRRYRSGGDDPWVMRCRLAAAMSGVLLFGAFIVAMMFVAGLHA